MSKRRKSKPTSLAGTTRPPRLPRAPGNDADGLSDPGEDEIDEFHDQRDKAGLSGVKIHGLYESDDSGSTQEVFGIEDAESSDLNPGDQEELSSNGSDDSDNVEEDFEKSLPSANAWGKKKSAYYKTDYVGDDHGGLSGSDIETAELDELEAKRLQQTLLQRIDEHDYLGDIQPPTKQPKVDISKPVMDSNELEQSISQMDKNQRKQFLLDQSPELENLIEELNDKNLLITLLSPLMALHRAGKLPNSPLLDKLQSAMEVYSNYIVNIEFYLVLKRQTALAKTATTRTHPVIDSIIRWKKLCTTADNLLDQYRNDLEHINSTIQNGASDLEISELIQEYKPPKRSKVARNSKISSPDNNLHDFYGEEEMDWLDDDDGISRRAVGKNIAKNRPMSSNKHSVGKKARKEKHSRVKRRRLYEKAVQKRKSQVPDVKREVQRYGGESRGIKAGVIKSVKLK